ncbi:hypothetical protein AB0J14_07095 [Micromonospora arborensis]|uniref:hypothetical protein n=1 Tax=Micromonospora arborensis TaxID=2116518 RepID=UPI0033C70053
MGTEPMVESPYLDRLRELVEPGEQVLAIAPTDVAQGIRPPEPPNAEQPKTSRGGFSPLGLLLNVLSPNVVFAAGDRFVDLVVWGIAGRGAPGSAASRLTHAHWLTLVEPGLRSTLLVVTNRRLLVCRGGQTSLYRRTDRAAEVAGTEIEWSAPRAEIAQARVGWHRLNPKRLTIEFTDHSWLAFTVPIAESGRPLREVASALSG